MTEEPDISAETSDDSGKKREKLSLNHVAKPKNGQGDDPVVIEKLNNRFGDHVIHEDLDLVVKRGEVLGVVGGSGSGKTVLLNSILGLHRPQSGDIHLFGQKLLDAKPEEGKALRAKTGVLFQGGALFSTLSVAENIMTPILEFTRLSPREARQIALLKMSMVGLPLRAADLTPSELSGGMIKRTALARALAVDAELIFLDEPTAGLDPIGAAAFDDLIRGLADSLGLTVFMITHDLDSLYAICDEIAVLADRHVVLKDRIEVLEKSDHPWIHEYFHGPRGRAKG
ncbi:ABC transporter family protein [Asticcacaulis biprosthecium C19]|uniref:ABC transporter family protein n=1 Tax=Asticcacaulis biprosthecium C19 TaxID=715226 RepID=F4QSI5_9CAUL|nr:ATP-binding cassette domain-containing protein [Asticcacaulis biprosthecium]EGF89705.1 ABC transporter family protein [Asticcacaulis biprosthecium C19]